MSSNTHVLIVTSTEKRIPEEIKEILQDLESRGIVATVLAPDRQVEQSWGAVQPPVLNLFADHDLTVDDLLPELIGVSMDDLERNVFEKDVFGYPIVVCEQHPFVTEDGTIQVHRLIAEAALRIVDPDSPFLVSVPWLNHNKFLPRSLPVLHKDGDLSNWHPQNLALFPLGDLTANYIEQINHDLQECMRENKLLFLSSTSKPFVSGACH